MENTAVEIIEQAKAYITQHGPYRYGQPIQKLMDLVSGVRQYRMAVSTDQGIIYHKLIRGIEHNHIVDIDMMVSKFWYGAIQSVLKAQPIGTKVNINNGTGEPSRKTRMAPLTYIRNMGIGAARKYIDECCKRKLRQLCHNCSTIASLGKQREIDSGCVCGSKESTMPHAFVRHTTRTCTNCGKTRMCRFERICGAERIDPKTNEKWVTNGCGSNNVSIIQIEDFVDSNVDAWEWRFGVTENDPETDALTNEMSNDVRAFAQECISSLPKNAANPTGDSQTQKLLRILIDPEHGIEICKECRDTDPGSCGAMTFDMGSCTNYSKKLGEYMGYSTNLANRRVKKIREHTIKFASINRSKFMTADYIAKKFEDTQNFWPHKS